MLHSNARRPSALLALAIGGLLAGASASAQQLGEIVVTARKAEERLQDVPISISAFRAEDLEERNARDVFDLTRFTPGFSFERINRYGVQGGVSRPVIRGMSNILGEGNASVFVDGILYSDSILAFPFDIVERVEIIKGPQAALFGRATFSGAINLVTKKGTNVPENEVSVRLAQYEDYEANVLSRGAIVDDRLFYMAHVRYYTFGGMYRNRLDGRRIGGEESKNVNASLEWRPGGAFSAILAAGYSEDDDDLAAATLQDRFANNCFLSAPRQYYCGAVLEQDGAALDRATLGDTEGVNRQSTRASLQLTWNFDAFSVVSNSGFFSTATEYGYDSTYQGATAISPNVVPGTTVPSFAPVRLGGVMRNEVTDRKEWSTELRVQSDEQAALRWLGGIYYYNSSRTLEERHFAVTAPTIYNGETEVKNWAVFGSLGYDFTERWNATVELRYAEDEISNVNPFVSPPRAEIGQTFDSWSPRVTTTFDLTPNNMLYANVARGNKPGVINADPRFPPELQFADEEDAWSYEVGTKNTLADGRVTANLALYYIDWTNQQITASFVFPTGGTMSYIRNAGKSEVRGLELELQSAITENFTAGLTYAYTDAEFVELQDVEAQELFGNPSLAGKSLPGVPEQQLSVFGRLDFPLGAATGFVRADASYTDRKYDQIFNLAHTGYQMLVNVSAGFELGAWQVSAFVNNVTDDRTPSSVTRYVDQMNLNVSPALNPNPALNNVPGSTNLERAFFFPLPAKRQFGVNLSYRFGGQG